MFKSQAVANIAFMLSGVSSVDVANAAITRALRATGLLSASTLDETELLTLLTALAAEGGPMQQIAMEIAVNGLDSFGSPGELGAMNSRDLPAA